MLAFVASALLAQGCRQKDSYSLGPDQDGDGWPRDLDCDDTDDRVFPGADEILGDDIDQDCSGSAAVGLGGMGGTSSGAGGNPQPMGDGGGSGGDGDGSGGTQADGGSNSRSNDADGDGFAAPPEGMDCDDDRLSVYPGAPEVPLNGIDENCDGSDLLGADQLVFPLGEDAVPLEAPALAHASVDGQSRFLVAWSDSRQAPGQDLYGQLVDEQGHPIGGEIPLEVDDNLKKTEVALTSKGDAFLLTWVTADGLFVRVLDSNGEPESIVLGFGPAGSVQPSPAYHDDHWAVAWRDGATGDAYIRAMTVENARGDVLELGSGNISSVSLCGGENGFLAAWAGPVDDESYGLLVQERSNTGYAESTAQAVLVGTYSWPVIAANDGVVMLGFIAGGAFGFAAAVALNDDLQPEQEQALRLSSETLAAYETSIAMNSHSAFLTWNDSRHTTHSPSAQAVYGNSVHLQGFQTTRPSGTPLAVDSVVQNGAVAASDEVVIAGMLFNERVGLLIRDANTD